MEQLASAYKTFFKKEGNAFFNERADEKCNYWLNALILADSTERDAFLKETNAKGVMTRPIWTLMNKLPMFEKCQCDTLENSQWLEDRVVNIPSSGR